MATKRFTDAEKWKDSFFEQLPKDYKLAWLYLLDDCDNAGVWNKSIKRLNFYCDTNFTEEEILKVFQKRLQPITNDKWFIKKFMEFQYGLNWLNSTNKAVVSAKTKLESIGVLIQDNNKNYTLSIPYEYSIDTSKDKDKDKVKGKEIYKETDKDKEYEKEMNEYMDTTFAEEEENDKKFREEMYEYMDYRFEQDRKKGMSEEEFDKLFKQE